MIELAPQHKTGLVIDRPIMPAAGFWGYGPPAYANIFNATLFGALVTNPITLRPRPHQAPPLALETNGGVLLTTPPRNPGARRVINGYSKFWRRAATPVIAHLPADDPADLARTAGALAGLNLLAGIELGLPRGARPQDARDTIQAIQQRSELPLLVRLPLENLPALSEAALDCGADALVIGAVPHGAGYTEHGDYQTGDYYGPGIVPQFLPYLADLRRRHPAVPLIVAGGVHTSADVRAYLTAGATAVQLDTLIFTNPAQVQQILTHL
jgi:dihydroorotate dehydrogenase (NAD+) catalytic subunit